MTNKELLLDYLNIGNSAFFNQDFSLNKLYEVIDECVFGGDNATLNKILAKLHGKILHPENPIGFSEVMCNYFERNDTELKFKGSNDVLNTLTEFCAEHDLTLMWGGINKDYVVCMLPSLPIAMNFDHTSNNEEDNALAIIGHNH